MNVLFAGLVALVVAQAGIPTGSAQFTACVNDLPIEVFTYKPAGFDRGPLILVFHGTGRNADEYRDDARAMADRFGALIAAPKFDAQRFPGRKYHRAGLLRGDGTVAPEKEWTGKLIPMLAQEVRMREGRPEMPYYLIGHSAGGQFLARVAGFVDTGARRVVISNPSAMLYPSRCDWLYRYPYGFGGLPDELSDDDHLKFYLAQPITIYLGASDTLRDEDLDDSPEADMLGQSRYERGRNVFFAGQALAKQKSWPFRWRLVEADGVGHDHEKIFNHPNCKDALFGAEGGAKPTPARNGMP